MPSPGLQNQNATSKQLGGRDGHPAQNQDGPIYSAGRNVLGSEMLGYVLQYETLNLLCYFYAGVNNVQQKTLGEALIIGSTTMKRAGALALGREELGELPAIKQKAI